MIKPLGNILLIFSIICCMFTILAGKQVHDSVSLLLYIVLLIKLSDELTEK